MANFWQKLKKPFFALAPMDDVTDTVFRQIIVSCGKPDVFFTEFVSADGLISSGQQKLLQKFQFSEAERPIVAQIWGTKPETMYQAAMIIKDLGFDGIDINMGCPDRSVVKSGAGGALIDNPTLAQEVILATQEGAGGLPLSVKTRIGFKTVQTEQWISFLLKFDLAALTVHGRTVAELSKVPAHWEEIGRAAAVRDQLGVKILLIGNGDVTTFHDGLKKAKQFKIDGIMIGRGIFKSPWIFNPQVDTSQVTPQKRLQLLLEHARLFDEVWQGSKNFAILKKFFNSYVRGFKGASDLRIKLMETKTLADVEQLVGNQ
ncbi:MAG: tRNA-dihydrouridine synthase [Candidatus Daviesbacteria bacterium GW2011_GWA1_41_61]|uniref:tRNA-dihydrouridine synthase n=1 Tax=Candidatus Daviesbacteria bacterium GW2011_GWA2_40_9 TaxID=1618424 RepID=A0A0G0U2B6_9BACT|nr:MAG: dihydrouridine synthase [Candidatus Daviesbacteria bacterium GW2011_GWC1_40_9]KKR83223.1 MAG: tRNA-dihydrouridine synthase [Candidatus Daviesbacteria bacterium GW2011_GWA2_40_9]KKR93568.1 MAG: tRNA-dihydrouridine synthase [Candidatus Daviesbacteria bacterium GW2011_GWB1_41_15]KKS14881.1 MAG: tRNA-dihydrouridine synthase [Candidatus Daviesbacteria bacterium GW2011_GWA1_41_61]